MILVGMSKTFERKIAARAVPDDGIDLKRKKVAKVPHIEQPTIEINDVDLMEAPMPAPVVEKTKFETDAEIYRAPISNVAKIQKEVAEFYGVGMHEIISARREAYIVTARHVAMWLTKELTSRSFVYVGRKFGDRDHTTVLSAMRRINQRRLIDRQLCDEISELKSRLMNGDKT